MSYVYLLDLHKLIDQKLAEAGQALERIESDPVETMYHQGRIEILTDLKVFLTRNLNPKLPRRIRKKHFGM
jgi:hypothetical protein